MQRPDLTAYDAVLFDLDGVVTPTADVHMRAWQATFEGLFAERGITSPYTSADYYDHLDGKKRYDGVASLLAARGLMLPWGDPADDPAADTVCGVGNRKNVFFSRLLDDGGVDAYPGTLALLDALAAAETPVAIVSSSKNAEAVLRAARVRDRFPVVMDGLVAEREGLPSKPAPDVFVAAAAMTGVHPSRAAAIEDAISGVESAAAGGFALVVGVDRGAGRDALIHAGAHLVVADLAELVPETEGAGS